MFLEKYTENFNNYNNNNSSISNKQLTLKINKMEFHEQINNNIIYIL